ncbi:unnamed protein product [Parnassius apollo]|uniref:(apollo) hypothetical protein n=1 Tax=Parnassius apollo TaxID=110799 RepID=A0A8S3XZR3_PARAO|nr:unnamed protein product [Parnassius apollo]
MPQCSQVPDREQENIIADPEHLITLPGHESSSSVARISPKLSTSSQSIPVLINQKISQLRVHHLCFRRKRYDHYQKLLQGKKQIAGEKPGNLQSTQIHLKKKRREENMKTD